MAQPCINMKFWRDLLVFVVCASPWAGVLAQPMDLVEKMEAEREARFEARLQRQLSTESSYLPPGAAAVRKEPKQIAVKRARAFMREIRASISEEAAFRAVAQARAEARERASGYVEVLPDQMLQAVGAVVDRLTKGIVLKYDFEGGFEQAIASVGEAAKRKGDTELQSALEAVAALFDPDDAKLYDVELKRHASSFVSMDTPGREAALQRVIQLRQSASDERGLVIDEYLSIMKGVLDEGDDYVMRSARRAVEEARKTERDGQKLSEDERLIFDRSVGAMLEFLSASQQAQLAAGTSDDAGARVADL